uniref:G_PROTEIN_RECEP_F1_2 domain-containing protein n=1 Tax=Rhabditophanes sp. KR3021 TaxID=114890 RepID=A0AC35TYZ7_9BILA
MMDSLGKTVELRGSQILNYERYHSLLWRRRLMLASTILTLLCILLFGFAVFSPNWTTINFQNTQQQHVNVALGVWGEVRTVSNSENVPGEPQFIAYFPNPPKEILRLDDTDLRHYYRAQAAFCLISLVLMFSNNALAIYTFHHHRYMYKRLVAFMHLIVAMCVIVTSEVLTSSVNEWNIAVAIKSQTMTDWHYKSQQQYGPGTYICWTVAASYIFAFCVFLMASSKQKGSRAATAEFEIEDRPVHIGR